MKLKYKQLKSELWAYPKESLPIKRTPLMPRKYESPTYLASKNLHWPIRFNEVEIKSNLGIWFWQTGGSC